MLPKEKLKKLLIGISKSKYNDYVCQIDEFRFEIKFSFSLQFDHLFYYRNNKTFIDFEKDHIQQIGYDYYGCHLDTLIEIVYLKVLINITSYLNFLINKDIDEEEMPRLQKRRQDKVNCRINAMIESS